MRKYVISTYQEPHGTWINMTNHPVINGWFKHPPKKCVPWLHLDPHVGQRELANQIGIIVQWQPRIPRHRDNLANCFACLDFKGYPPELTYRTLGKGKPCSKVPVGSQAAKSRCSKRDCFLKKVLTCTKNMYATWLHIDVRYLDINRQTYSNNVDTVCRCKYRSIKII